MSNGSPMNLGLLLAYCRHIRRHIGVMSNIPGICRGFSFAVILASPDLLGDLDWTSVLLSALFSNYVDVTSF